MPVTRFKIGKRERGIIIITRITAWRRIYRFSRERGGGSREFLETRESSARFEINSSARREEPAIYSSRDAGRRLIKTESTLRPTEKTCPRYMVQRYFRRSEERAASTLHIRISCPRNWFAPNNYSLPGKTGFISLCERSASPIRARRCILLCMRWLLLYVFPMQSLRNWQRSFFPSYDHPYLNWRKINFIKFE